MSGCFKRGACCLVEQHLKPLHLIHLSHKPGEGVSNFFCNCIKTHTQQSRPRYAEFVQVYSSEEIEMKATHIPSQRLFSFSFVAKEIKSPPKSNSMAEVKSSCRTLLFSTQVSKLAGFELAHFFVFFPPITFGWL